LVSISFRPLCAEEIIRITKNAGLDAIEWGGDLHVPAGDLDTARAVAEKTRRAGLFMPEYGSYYRLGVSTPEEISGVAACAHALEADIVRLWAFNKGSMNVTAEEYRRTVADAKRICAAYPDLTFCTECHNHTLTDDYRANLRLIEAEPTVKSGGQKSSVRSFRAGVTQNFKDEIDLRGKTGDEAWLLVDKYLDTAVLAGFHTVRLIHGKGTGALKVALWKYLKADKRIGSFRIGQYGEGDGGVTVVELK
jgi:DNA-nicking Smr family endonuclease